MLTLDLTTLSQTHDLLVPGSQVLGLQAWNLILASFKKDFIDISCLLWLILALNFMCPPGVLSANFLSQATSLCHLHFHVLKL